MLAITGGKGGCGKTTIALGLALTLGRTGRRPLVVDADVDVPDLHIRAGVDPEPGLDELAEGALPERVAQPSPDVPGVDIVAAGATSACPPAALRRLQDLARPVLLDCPAGAGPTATGPLREATACVIVTTDRTESRQDAAKSVAMADSLGVPVRATVCRDTGGGGPDRSGSHGASAGIIERATGRTVVAVPTVDGRPLADERVLDPLATISRDIERSGATDCQRFRGTDGRGDRKNLA